MSGDKTNQTGDNPGTAKSGFVKPEGQWCSNVLSFQAAKKRNLLNMKLHPYAVPTLSLGFPSEPCGEPAELDCTRTNSSLVTVATDSVELLTLLSEELSSMASRFPEGWPGRTGWSSPLPSCVPSSKGRYPAYTTNRATQDHSAALLTVW